MPELPEVETIVRLIRPRVQGRSVVGTRMRWKPTLGGLSPARFGRAVRGAELARVWRRAKYFVIDLERGGRPAGALVGHLRMTGRLFVEPSGVDPGPYARLSLELDDGHALHFVDVRKFGRLTWRAEPGELFEKLGPEPLGEGFTAEWLHAALGSRRRALKPLLLDQNFLAGLGNIYVDESLFAARLHPLTPSDRVSARKARELWTAIREILSAAIEGQGSSFDTFYRTPEGQPGSYQDQFRVYGREGQPCRRCGREVRKLVVAQRGTHLCPRCQPRPRKG